MPVPVVLPLPPRRPKTLSPKSDYIYRHEHERIENRFETKRGWRVESPWKIDQSKTKVEALIIVGHFGRDIDRDRFRETRITIRRQLCVRSFLYPIAHPIPQSPTFEIK